MTFFFFSKEANTNFADFNKNNIMRSILIFLLLLPGLLGAQQKQMTLEDAILGRSGNLRREALKGLTWKNETTFSYVKNDTLWEESVKKAEKKPVVSLRELNRIAVQTKEKAFSSYPEFSWEKNGQLVISSSTDYFLFDTEKKQFNLHIELPDEAENNQFSSEGKFVAYTVNDDLYVTFSNGETIQITTDGGKGIVNGKTVHRVEFGITKGIFISPDGNYIAFYRKDESMVYDYPLVDYMAREAEYTPVKYPMAGEASHHVTVGVYAIESGQTIFLNTDEPLDHYLTNIAWSPDEKHIYIAELNREQNHMEMNRYNISTGEKEKTLFEERHDKYVEPLHPVLFSPANKNELYYLTRRDGWFHIYKYSTDGELLQQVTKGEWEVTKILGFDDSEKYVFIEATKKSPLEIQLYRVEIKSGKTERLTAEEGIHSGILSPEGGYLIDEWEAPDVPGQTDLIAAKGKKIRTLHRTKDPLADYLLGENTLVDIPSADGKYNLTGRLIKPVNFDPNKKYPVVVYVYGGPHSQLVTKSWHNDVRWWQYYMATQGFVSFTMDNRGTNNRGRAFETAIHRQLGILETEDQMEGVKFLKSLPYVDENRIGVHGWSYGGFMTLNMMLRHPETFPVGVAGGPVTDWKLYEVMYGERYMDMPDENPEGYKETKMADRISDLEGKLLVIHGVQDETVVMQHSMQLLREAVKNNVPIDFFAYPTHPHNVRGKDRIHLMQKVSDYFIENLKNANPEQKKKEAFRLSE